MSQIVTSGSVATAAKFPDVKVGCNTFRVLESLWLYSAGGVTSWRDNIPIVFRIICGNWNPEW